MHLHHGCSAAYIGYPHIPDAKDRVRMQVRHVLALTVLCDELFNKAMFMAGYRHFMLLLVIQIFRATETSPKGAFRLPANDLSILS